jgi:Carboxypeptidase regulatory-like domain/TonB dependent receptor/TonB-dependent Receptor Plug Domain
MTHRLRKSFRVGLLVLLTAAFCSAGTLVFAQGGVTQTLSGTVVDTSGAVIPGADVSAKHDGTGVVSTGVTNSEGIFSIPSLPGGTYTVIVTLQGFKTAVIKNVVLTSGAGASVKATMEVGGISEQVTVVSASEVVQTQASGVSQTINTNQITKLPLTSRSAMDFVNMLPGVSSSQGNRQAVINGLPRTAINITLDGVNVQDNTNKGLGNDGFFAIVSPRLDAIEEVTVSTAAQGTDATAGGAAQIKFVTRSGTNNFTGSGYWYYRNDKLNANTWFNDRDGVAKAKLLQNQEGFRFGGPIVLPGFNGHNKAFFFVNYEEFHQPADTTRVRTVLGLATQGGLYTYPGGSINVLALAAAKGQLATVDPTIAKLLSDINSATASTGSLGDNGDPNQQKYTYNLSVASLRRYPTARVDYNLTDKHRLTSAFNYQYFTDTPDTLNNLDSNFPGFPVQAGQSSIRLSWSNGIRSTLSRNMVNQATAAYSGAPVKFFDELNTGMFTGTVANQQGFAIGFPSVGSALTSAGANPSPQSRNATTLDITDNLTWLKGAHSVTFGGGFSSYHVWLKNSTLVPRMSLGLVASDPANSLFTTANFPGASSANLTAAGNLYAMLTGRVTQISGDARIDASGNYVYEGTGLQEGAVKEFAGYVQDQWRLKSNLTLNVGVRYDVQLPFTASNSSYTFGDIANICGVSGAASANSCNLFQPGNQPGVHPVFQQYKSGVGSFNTDLNNFGPSVGAAWTPQARPGFIGKLMGPGDFVVRGGYARSFSRPAIGDFTAIFSNNPGITTPVLRSDANGLLLNGGPAPLLLRNSASLTPAPFPASPTYPLQPPSITSSIAGFDPNIQIPYADSWQAGITRSIGQNTAFEARYVGTHGYKQWGDYNYNEQDIVENGFLSEFRLAQGNLKANIAAGKGNTFAYTGAAGTNPLPTFLAFYDAQNKANAGNPALYTGSSWTNSTFLGFLAPLNPNPFGFASTNSTNGLVGNATFRTNAATAGVPANFFLVNPDLLGGATVRSNQATTSYNALQLELRQRLSQGLQFQLSYVFDHGYNSTFFGFRSPQQMRRTTGQSGDLTHAIKSNVVYDLPFGRGHRFGGSVNGVMDRVIGGWQIGVASKVQSGSPIDLGNVRLNGMTANDVQGMFKLRFDDAGRAVYLLPQDVIDNTILAFAVSPTSASGYAGAAPTGRFFSPANGPDCIELESGVGSCGTGALIVNGPLFQQHDIRISKRTTIVGHVNFEFAAEMLNAFNHPNFLPVNGVGSTANTLTGFQITGLNGTNTSRTVQLVTRINW